MTTTELCACGKPADHVNADPDTDEGTWACLVANFDPATGVHLPPVGKYAPAKTAGQELDEIMRDLDSTTKAWAAAGHVYDCPESEAREAVFARLKAWNAKQATEEVRA